MNKLVAFSAVLATACAAPVAVSLNMGDLLEAVETDAAGANHLWFNYVADYGCKGCDRCGEVDAAPRIPPALFELKNIGKLAQYASLTTQLYQGVSGMTGGNLHLGKCRTRGYNLKQSAMDGVAWAPSELMGPICLKQCDCVASGAWSPGVADKPYCKDAPDDPKAGKWCSLCGPKYNSYIKIQLYNKADSEEQ